MGCSAVFAKQRLLRPCHALKIRLIASTCRQGNQGNLDTASKGTMEDEFGTSKEDDVMQQIIEKGTIVESEVCLTCLPLSCVPDAIRLTSSHRRMGVTATRTIPKVACLGIRRAGHWRAIHGVVVL